MAFPSHAANLPEKSGLQKYVVWRFEHFGGFESRVEN